MKSKTLTVAAVTIACIAVTGCTQPVTDKEIAEWDARYFSLFGNQQDWRCQAAYRETMGGLRSIDNMLAVCADTAPTKAAHERTCGVANNLYANASISLEANEIICRANSSYPN